MQAMAQAFFVKLFTKHCIVSQMSLFIYATTKKHDVNDA